MRLFYRRPAALVLTFFILLSFIGFYISATAKILTAAVFAAVILSAVALLLMKKDKKRVILVIALSAAAILALVRSFVYFDIEYAGYQRFVGQNTGIEGTVIDIRYENSFSTGYSVYIRTPDGDGFNAILDCEFEGVLRPGQSFRAIADAQKLGYGDHTGSDVKSEIADGYMLRFVVTAEDDYETISEDAGGLSVAIKKLNRSITSKIRYYVGGEQGDIAAAITFGNRSRLDYSTERDFRGAGASHLLALSGMHMAIVMGLLDFLLKKLRVTKAIRLVMLTALMAFYLALTGFSVSATRAALMLFMVYISYFFSRHADSLTSLALAGGIIIAVSPGAVVDVGFWLSYLATLGIIVAIPVADSLFEWLYVKPNGKRRRALKKPVYKVMIKIIKYLAASVAATLAANAATSLVIWLTFGEISLMTVFTNLIVSPICEVMIIFTLLFVITLPIPGVSRIMASLVRATASLMQKMCHYFASKPGSVISLKYDFAGYIIIAMSAVLAVLLIVKLRRRWLLFVPPLVAALAFSVCLGVYYRNNADILDVAYLHNGKNEMIVATQNGKAFICDISDGSYSNTRAALLAADEGCATDVSVYMLTHYHRNHVATVYRLLNSEFVSQLWLPMPTDDKDYDIMWSLIYYADDAGVGTVIYSPDEKMKIFGDGIISAQKAKIKRSTHPVITLCLDYRHETMLYIGASTDESSLYDEASGAASAAENIILGVHGPITKKKYSYAFGGKNENLIFANDTVMVYCDVESLPDAVLIRAPECRFFRLGRKKEMGLTQNSR